MPRFSLLTTSSCLALMLGATSSLADVSANDVWSDWKEYITGFGYTLTGDEQATGNGLSIKGVKLDLPLPEAAGSMSVSMGNLDFVEQGDGSVNIVMSENWSFSFDVDDAGDDVAGTMVYAQTAPSLVVTGDPDALVYTYSAEQAVMSIDDLNVDGTQLGADVFTLKVTVDDISSVTKMSKGELRSYDQSLESSNVSYTFIFKDPLENASLDMRGEARGLAFKGAGDIPEGLSTDNASAMIQAGFAFAGEYLFSGGESQVTFDGPDGSGTINSTSGGGTFAISMSEKGLGYETETKNLAVNGLMSTFPLPMSFEAQSAVFDLLIPTIKSPEAQDFGFTFSLKDFTIADSLWGLFDPTAQLPRDPATLTLALSGKAKLLFDYLDPAQAAVLEETDTVPGELEAITLGELTLDVAGARLSGSGDFTFDNSDTVTFDGFPKPTGAIDLGLVGGNGLLDKLVGVGLLPEDQAQGARLMMGLFARPGEGEDSLTSKIEVNELGHVLANGQRIK